MDANTIMAAATLATVVTGFLGTIAKMHYDQKQREQNRRWDVEDRQRVADSVQAHNESIVAGLTENTTLTRLAAQKADDAFKEANSVNLKIASMGKDAAAYVPPSQERQDH